MMLQAMGLVKSGRIAPSPVLASLPLPDYLGVASRLAGAFEAAGAHGDVCACEGHSNGEEANDELWPFPLLQDCPKGRL